MAKRALRLKFKSHRTEKASDGSSVMILNLSRKIHSVKGSQIIRDGDGGFLKLTLEDVDEVRIHERDAASVQIDMKKKNVWTRECSLDVSKAGHVWLVKELFVISVRRMREETRRTRIMEIIERHRK